MAIDILPAVTVPFKPKRLIVGINAMIDWPFVVEPGDAVELTGCTLLNGISLPEPKKSFALLRYCDIYK